MLMTATARKSMRDKILSISIEMLGKTRILPKILYFAFIFARYELVEKRGM